MLSHIKSFFQGEFFSPDDNGTTILPEEKRRLACAALLIEVAVIDNEFDSSEFEALQTILQKDFGISQEECSTLTALAEQECAQATSSYQFTQQVNLHCSPEEKFKLIKGMWTIAYADNDLDKYEEYAIRKVADLIYVPHSDFIKAKIEARPFT